MRCLFALLVACAAMANAAIDADEVTSLPGFSGPLPSKQYSGYLQIPGTQKRLHYWFSESEKDPANDPLFVWFNGGPGCSSMGGMLQEQGQFHVMDSNFSQLYYNNYTWAKEVNIIFLEAPVGVGFSYSEDPADYSMNDTSTADDNMAALGVWMAGFPEYASHDFYISGESYAGIYVPSLAYTILMNNAAGNTKFNLKGILVGNGCTGTEVGICGAGGEQISAEFFWMRGLYSDATHDEITKSCTNWMNPSSACNDALDKMGNEIGRINIYDIYAPCNPTQPADDDHAEESAQLHAPVGIARHLDVTGPDECLGGSPPAGYLNQDSVQEALHVAGAKQYWKEWSICSNTINYTPNIKNEPRDIYPTLIKSLDVMIYNGDVDGCVPVTDNEAWTEGMGYPKSTPWTAWNINHQVAGYYTEYDVSSIGTGAFRFVTVHGSGHMVPQFQPERALVMLQNYLAGSF